MLFGREPKKKKDEKGTKVFSLVLIEFKAIFASHFLNVIASFSLLRIIRTFKKKNPPLPSRDLFSFAKTIRSQSYF